MTERRYKAEGVVGSEIRLNGRKDGFGGGGDGAAGASSAEGNEIVESTICQYDSENTVLGGYYYWTDLA